MELKLITHEKPAKSTPTACVIWMHGLGANAEDMMGVAAAFPESLAISHVFLDAPIRPVTINNNLPMRAWYDIIGFNLNDREDKDGILASARGIEEVIKTQLNQGFKPEQIFLAGFSQGAAMALFTGLTCKVNIGGIISLSGYLPIIDKVTQIKYLTTPIFLGLGEYDQVVLPAWTYATYNWLIKQNLSNTTLNKYPIEHTISIEELKDIYIWLKTHLSVPTVVEKN